MFNINRSNSSSSISDNLHSSNSYTNDDDENIWQSDRILSDDENDNNVVSSDNIFLRDDVYAREYSNRKKWNIPAEKAVNIPAVNQNIVSLYDQEKLQSAGENQNAPTNVGLCQFFAL